MPTKLQLPTLATLALAAVAALLPAGAQQPPAGNAPPPGGAEAPTQSSADSATAAAGEDAADPAAQLPTIGDRRGKAREAMWRAPTAEEWAQPCLIPWERTFDDALAVSAATGKAVLACVNMDGEIASEHYAGVRYRQPEVAELFEQYVCVIASVYRHTPRDYDEDGNRIECPRFGTVTCGEHILNEPELYRRFLDGQRVSPRHIMIELDGSEVYDVYYALDTASVFDTVREGILTREFQPPPDTGDDVPLLERVASRAADDMEFVERSYREGDRDRRRAILRKSLEIGEDASIDLLRLAIFGLDVELAELARESLAKTSSPKAADLLAEALRVPLAEGEREMLLAALERQQEHTPWAKSLASVYRGLTTTSNTLDVDAWSEALAEAETEERRDRVQVVSRVDYGRAAAKENPDDAMIKLELAEASLEFAVDPDSAAVLSSTSGRALDYQKLVLEDARVAALEAEALGATGWRVDATLAISSFVLGDIPMARQRAEAAVTTLPTGEVGWNAISVLSIFAEARREAIDEAQAQGEEWPPEWLTDVHAAYSVISRHPLGTESLVVRHVDFLRGLGAINRAWGALDEGLARFPDSWELHKRKRWQILAQSGYQGLEPGYRNLLESPDASINTAWYAGLATLTAAEYDRRNRKREAALATYDRAIALYDRAIVDNPDSRANSDHYAAMALGGQARVLMELGRLEEATAAVEASFARYPDAADTLDGLNFSTAATAKDLRWRLRRDGEEALWQRVHDAILSLPQAELLPAEFDRVGPARRTPDGRRPLDRDSEQDRGSR